MGHCRVFQANSRFSSAGGWDRGRARSMEEVSGSLGGAGDGDRIVQAREFWPRAISAFIAAPIEPVVVEKNGVRWHLFARSIPTMGSESV